MVSTIQRNCGGCSLFYLAALGLAWFPKLNCAGLLYYSRVSMRPYTPEIVDLNEALSQAIDSTRKSIEDSHASIVVRDLPSLRADSAQMIRVFQNLLGNAIKFRAEPSPAIEIGAAQEELCWKIWIRDNGIGFDPREKDIFQIFQRLHTHNKYPGTGIGLSICKTIIERLGGSIWVESMPGSGSTFYFTLPAL